MEIIIEYVLIDNLIINYLILFLSCKLIKRKVVVWRLLASSAIGTVCALILPILSLPTYAVILFKLVLAILMIRISFHSETFKKGLLSLFVFVVMTAVMGGFCFFVIYLLSGDISSGLMMTYTMQIPVGAILAVVALVSYCLWLLIKKLYGRKIFSSFIFPIKIIDNGKQIEIDAFLDSGNTLMDPVTDKPVVIINYQTFSKLFDVPIERIMMRKVDEKDIATCHYINFNTLNKKTNQMLVFEVQEIEIKADKEIKKVKNAILGLSFARFKNSFNCDALLHPQIMES